MNIPILMYHSISSPENIDIRPAGYWLTPKEFKEQLHVLRQAGATSVTLDQLLQFQLHQTPLPENPFIITFDDGYRNNLREATPILLEFGFTATFFITAGTIGSKYMLAVQDLQELQATGMAIGSHGLTHELYRGRHLGWLQNELLKSKSIIEEAISREVKFFSLPRGYLPPGMGPLVREAGYQGMCTSHPGNNFINTSPYGWRRFAIRSGDKPSAVTAILSGEGWRYHRIYLRENTRAILRRRHSLLGIFYSTPYPKG